MNLTQTHWKNLALNRHSIDYIWPIKKQRMNAELEEDASTEISGAAKTLMSFGLNKSESPDAATNSSSPGSPEAIAWNIAPLGSPDISHVAKAEGIKAE